MFSLPITITVNDSGKTWELEYQGEGMLQIGRSPECDITIDADKASRLHAQILSEGGTFTLVDHGSANGTSLNGEKVESSELSPGDVIRIGQAVMTFGEAPPAPSEPAVTPSAVAAEEPAPAAAPPRAKAPARAGKLPSGYAPSPGAKALQVLLPVVFLVVLAVVLYFVLVEAGVLSRGDDDTGGTAQTPVGGSGGDPVGTPGRVGDATPSVSEPGSVAGSGDTATSVDDVPLPFGDPPEAMATLDEILGLVSSGDGSWSVIEDLRQLQSLYPGTRASAQAIRWSRILTGLRDGLEKMEAASIEGALDELTSEERYGEAVAAARFLEAISDGDDRDRWGRRARNLDELARAQFHEVEQDLGALIEAGRPDEALRALVDQRSKFAGSSAFDDLLPQFVEAGLDHTRLLAKGSFRGDAVMRLEEQAATAFNECRFRDLAPIQYRILGLNPPADIRVAALDTLVDAFYLGRMFEDFLASVGEVPEAALAEDYGVKVVRADGVEVEIEREIEGHPYRVTKRWSDLSTAEKASCFFGAQLSPDGRLGLALFCLRIGYEEGAHTALRRLRQRDESEELVDAILARHLGIAIPEGGFVVHKGRLVTPASRDAAIAAARAARAAEEQARAELKELKKSNLLASYIERAIQERKSGNFELAHKILNTIASKKSFASTPEAAEARRLMENPVLKHTILIDNGNDANRLHMVFLGDGYPVEDDYQEAFMVQANTCMKLLLTEEPYREYRSYIDFSAIYLGSKDRGLDRLPNVHRDTALDGQIEWDVFTCNGGKVHSILKEVLGEENDGVGIVIGNDFAGVATGGGGVVCLSKAGLTPVGHELGHAIGGLHDEYDNPAGNDPNRDIVKERKKNVPTKQVPPNVMEGSDRDDVLAHSCWKWWIDAPDEARWNGAQVGAFEGAAYSPFNKWRPQANCKMRSASNKFCVVCMEVMVLALYRYVRPIDKVEPSGDELVLEDGKKLYIKIWPMKPETHFLEAKWYLLDLGGNTGDDDDGPTGVRDERKGELFRRVGRTFDADGRVIEFAELSGRNLQPGRYRLTLEISDPTPWVIRDPEGLLKQELDWIITVP